MSPRLTSSSTSAPASRDSAITRSSTAMPAAAEPLVERRLRLDHRARTARAPRRRSARTAPARRRRRSRPHSCSSAACGSMPAQSGPRASDGGVERGRRRVGHAWSLLRVRARRRGGRRWSGRGGARCRPGRRVGAGARNGAGVVGGGDAAAGRRSASVGQVGVHLGDAPQRQRTDRGPAEPAGTAVGQRRGQRVADDDGVGAGVERRCARVSTTRTHVGAQLGEHRACRAAGRGARPRRPPAAWNGSRTSKTPPPRASGAERFTSTPSTPGRAAEPAGELGVLPQRARRRSRRRQARLLRPTTAARWPGTARARGSAKPTALTRPLGVSTMRGGGAAGSRRRG